MKTLDLPLQWALELFNNYYKSWDDGQAVILLDNNNNIIWYNRVEELTEEYIAEPKYEDKLLKWEWEWNYAFFTINWKKHKWLYNIKELSKFIFNNLI